MFCSIRQFSLTLGVSAALCFAGGAFAQTDTEAGDETEKSTVTEVVTSAALVLLIIAAEKEKKYALALELLKQFEELGAVKTPPLLRAIAIAYFHVQQYRLARENMQAYLDQTGTSDPEYEVLRKILSDATRAIDDPEFAETLKGQSGADGDASMAEFEPKCNTPTREGDPDCWIQVSNHAGCYVYYPTPINNRTLTWSGSCQNGQPDGAGEEAWKSDGRTTSRRNGAYVDGKRHGQWEELFVDFSIDTGPYVDGKKHGQWEVRWDDGSIETRPYVDGKRHGQWEKRRHDGSIVTGPYVDGEPHGQWEVRYADGPIETWTYIDGILQ